MSSATAGWHVDVPSFFYYPKILNIASKSRPKNAAGDAATGGCYDQRSTISADELRLAGKVAVNFLNLHPQLAKHMQTLQLEVKELEAYIKFVSNFQFYEAEMGGCLVRQRVSASFSIMKQDDQH